MTEYVQARLRQVAFAHTMLYSEHVSLSITRCAGSGGGQLRMTCDTGGGGGEVRPLLLLFLPFFLDGER